MLISAAVQDVNKSVNMKATTERVCGFLFSALQDLSNLSDFEYYYKTGTVSIITGQQTGYSWPTDLKQGKVISARTIITDSATGVAYYDRGLTFDLVTAPTDSYTLYVQYFRRPIEPTVALLNAGDSLDAIPGWDSLAASIAKAEALREVLKDYQGARELDASNRSSTDIMLNALHTKWNCNETTIPHSLSNTSISFGSSTQNSEWSPD